MVTRPERMRAGPARGPPYSRARLTTNILRFVRVTKYLIAGVTVTIFCVSWIASVNNSADNEWRGVRWSDRKGGGGLPTMRTIVAYSEGKQAEMDRPSPVACDRLPAFPKVPYINRTWSPEHKEESVWQRVDGTRVSLYAAFYDDRSPQRYIRILAKFEGRNFSREEPLFCQTRVLNPYEGSVEVVVAKPLEIWYYEWDATSLGLEMPLLLSCPLTDSLYRPSVVSVVTQPCDDPTNAFYIEASSQRKYERNFTICVKDMHFENDISQSLVEWIETNKLLGVEKIDIYIDKIVKESEDVLMRYRDQGYVRLFNVPIKYKPEWDLWQNRKYHLITYNDCLYRNLRESEFVIPLDIDEIILPKIADTLPELVKRLKKSGWESSQETAILIRNVFFFGFMQGVDKYNQKKIQTKNDMYVKRDDVRIKRAENLVVGEIELVDDTNRNEVIDYNVIDEDLRDVYKSRCKGDLPIPKLVQYVVRSTTTSPVGHYSKSLMLTRRVLTAFNHYPLHALTSNFIEYGGWPAPFSEVQLNHYKESCNTTVMPECLKYGRRARVDRSALRLRRRLTTALAAAPCTTINIT